MVVITAFGVGAAFLRFGPKTRCQNPGRGVPAGRGVATGIGLDAAFDRALAGGASEAGAEADARGAVVGAGAGGMLTFGVSPVEGLSGAFDGVRGGGGGSAC